ncbi:hypothetical protein CEXT_243211 [Caerostris extrusa]|nr:hypothetical protein CEXT_243211 [Caerostris extrusa]
MTTILLSRNGEVHPINLHRLKRQIRYDEFICLRVQTQIKAHSFRSQRINIHAPRTPTLTSMTWSFVKGHNPGMINGRSQRRHADRRDTIHSSCGSDRTGF